MRTATLFLVIMSLNSCSLLFPKPKPEMQQPKFKGGSIYLGQFITEHMVYPEAAIVMEVEGQVLIKFVVTTEGKVRDAKVVSKPLGYGLEKEALRVVALTSGRWKPGILREKPVNMRIMLPIRFILD